MISLENNPHLKKDKDLEEKLIPLLSELETESEKQSECSLAGHPNAECHGISSASGAMYYCPDCNHYLFNRALTEQQQKDWNDAMSVVYSEKSNFSQEA